MKKRSNIKKFGRGYVRHLQLAAVVFLGVVVAAPRSPGYGGGGCTAPTLAWSGTPVCNTRGGYASTLKVCCLTPNTAYSLGEHVTMTGNCTSALDQTANPVAETTDAGGCFSVSDDNSISMGLKSCSQNVTQVLTVYDANNNTVATFTDTGAFSFDAAGKLTFSIGGDGGSGTMHCPAN
jgi:hypothetical protein